MAQLYAVARRAEASAVNGGAAAQRGEIANAVPIGGEDYQTRFESFTVRASFSSALQSAIPHCTGAGVGPFTPSLNAASRPPKRSTSAR